jgi:REP-associated tyrosine transposase
MPFDFSCKEDELVTPYLIYKALGRSQLTRLEAYKALFKAHLDKGVLDNIRSAWQTGTSLGNDLFRQKIEAKLKCKVGQARRGRPQKPKDESSLVD